MPRVSGSLVTEADLNGVYSPKGGYVPTTDASLILSADVILARYNVNIAGGVGLRCPSWDQITSAATTATTEYEMLLSGAAQSTNYMLATINSVNHIDTRSGALSGTKELPLGQSVYVNLTKQGPVPYCSIGVYDITGGGRTLIWYYETPGTRFFDMIGGKKYRIEGYAGTGIPLGA